MSADRDWDRPIGQKLKLRDLQVIFIVAEQGSMAKAATVLGITQSAVSQMIADLELYLGVRIFDRSRRGVDLTVYGRALMRSGRAAFDELRLGLQEIDFLRNEGTGLIRIGCPETLAASVLPLALERFSSCWPDVVFEVQTFPGAAAADKLRDRSIDLVLFREGVGVNNVEQSDEFRMTRLFEDELKIVVGANSVWAHSKATSLADLAEAPWIILPYGWGEEMIPNAFRALGLAGPRTAIKTFSIHLRLHLLMTGRFVTALPQSVIDLHRGKFAIVELPIDLPRSPYGVAIVTLRGRTLSRVVEHFIESTTTIYGKVEGET